MTNDQPAASVPFYGGIPQGLRPANAPWECPRCGRINAWWVASCRCKPPTKGPRRGI